MYVHSFDRSVVCAATMYNKNSLELVPALIG